jgi:hypothetical protein
MNVGGKGVEVRAWEMRDERRVEVWRDSRPGLRMAALPGRKEGRKDESKGTRTVYEPGCRSRLRIS